MTTANSYPDVRQWVMEAEIMNDIERYRNDIMEGVLITKAVNKKSKINSLRLGFLRSTYVMMVKWVDTVRIHRAARDGIRNDNGPDRTNEEVVGKLAEMACVIFQEIMPLATARGGFNIDLNIYQKGSLKFDDDLAPGVSVKTHMNNAYELSWLIDRNDPMGIDPSPQDVIILCKAEYCERSHFAYYIDILGYVMAKEMVEKELWFRAKKLSHKKAIYAEDKLMLDAPPAFEVKGMSHAIIHPTQPPLERNW